MRKSILLQMLAAYDEQKQQEKNSQFFQRDISQIDLLKQFVKTERIKQLDDHDDISFHKDFFSHLSVEQRSLFNKEFFEKPSASAEIFRQFIKTR